MSATKEIQLGLAAFLDSEHARALGVPPEDARRIAEAFLAVAFEEVGKHPRFFDGDDLTVAVAELLPGCFAPRDPAIEHAGPVLEALLRHIEETAVVAHAFELRVALDDAVSELARVVRAGTAARRRVPLAEQKPFVHGAPKLGRNDPCSCGSGRKYKKCHGKEG